jgi:hypothetical protein
MTTVRTDHCVPCGFPDRVPVAGDVARDGPDDRYDPEGTTRRVGGAV